MASTAINVNDEPSQRSKVTLFDTDFFIHLNFNKLDNLWRLDIERLDGTFVFRGRPVVLGMDFLRGTAVTGVLLAIDNSEQSIEADFDGLTSGRVQLIYVDPI